MWTATIESKGFSKGVFQIGVIYSNGSDTFSEVHQLRGVSDAESAIKSRLSQLNSIDLSQIQLGSYTPPSPPIPTQAEIDKQNYLTLLSQWETAKLDVSKGLLDKTNADFVQLESDLKTAYKPEYSGL